MSIEILPGGAAQEKTAYLTAIASITTSDNVASDEELQYLLNLASHAGLSESDKVVVQQAALDTTGSGLKPALDTLKSSELRYSLVTDLIAFAESDSNLAAEEKEHIADVAQYLGISAQQLDALNAYVQHAASQPQEAFAAAAAPAAGGGLPDSLGIGNTLQNSGINLGSVAKGLLSFVGPMILSNLMSKGLNRGNTNPNAGMGGLGNLGSLLGGLTSGRGMSGMGGLLSGLLR